MKVLVAYEYRYRFYREVLAKAIGNHRPHLQVRHVDLEKLSRELVVFNPHVVVSSQPNSIDPNKAAAWVELPAEPSYPTNIYLNRKNVKLDNPPLVELLRIMDEAEARLWADLPLDGC